MKKPLLHISAVIALLVVLTGCTTLGPQADPSPTATVVHTPKPTPTPTPKPIQVPMVTNPWVPGEFQTGVQIFWHPSYSSVEQQIRAANILNYIVSLGGNSVAITFPICINGRRPTQTVPCTDTPSPTDLGYIIAQAQARKLRVTVRPLIDEANLMPATWRGAIAPPNVDAWFTSYDSLLLSYVPTLVQYQVPEFVLGSEMITMQRYTAEWQKLQQEVTAAGYTGTESYSMVWSSAAAVPFNSLGLDAYPNLNLPDSASQAQVTAGLAQWYSQYQPVANRLAIEEVGIAEQSGAYHDSVGWGTGPATPGLEVQATWFASTCAVARSMQLQGIYFWMIDANAQPYIANPNTESAGTWIGRPGTIAAIKQCFGTP